MEQREKNIFPWILGGAAAWLLYAKVLKPKYVAPAKLQAYAARIRVQMPAMRFKGDNVEFDLYVQNPNPYPLTINGIVGDIWIISQAHNYKLGNVNRYGNVTLAPLMETKYTFSVRTRFLGLLPYFSDLAQGKIKNQVLTFAGTITIDKRPWPIKESLKIS